MRHVRARYVPSGVLHMSISAVPEEAFRSLLATAIESLRYWRPTVFDAARVEEAELTHGWRLSSAPLMVGACPFSVTLRSDRLVDLTVAGETYGGLSFDDYDDVLRLMEAIAGGNVVQRRYHSVTTGALLDVETVVTLADGKTWKSRRAGSSPAARGIEPETRERHFLPYRR
jgi:hypothetical protein